MNDIYEVFPWDPGPWDDRVREVLSSWEDTPYCAGGSAKGVGVDCVRFIACAFNELDGKVRKPLARLPRDTAFHSESQAKAALREFLRIYSPYERVEGESIQSGDVIVVQPEEAAGPGHALIATAENKMLMHAGAKRVETIHVAQCGMIHAIFRPLYKENWLHVTC